jgi:hypothetical protein
MAGHHDPRGIFAIPPAKEYSTLKQTQDALAVAGKKGVSIAVQNNNADWRKAPGSGNFATFFGTYWEYANHGDATPGRMIIHSPSLPGGYKYTVFIAVPLP